MTKIIEVPKIKKLKNSVYNPEIKTIPMDETKLKVLRIELNEDYTRIDFVGNNEQFGWVQIDPNSFIRPTKTKSCHRLVKAEGIAIAPQKHFFNRANQTFYFTLYFPAIPKNIKEIDIIEQENSNDSYFNFYGVSIEKIQSQTIKVNN